MNLAAAGPVAMAFCFVLFTTASEWYVAPRLERRQTE